jgi:DnaJ-class molecular chaperone
MNKTAYLLVLLALCAVVPAGHSQEAVMPEAAQQDVPAKPPARRPKLPGDITFESSVGRVLFPHKVHQRMGCQKCHHQIHAKDLITPHDEYLTYSWVNCRDCHDETQNHSAYYGCAKCHHSNLENIADETLNAKVVVHKSCWKCHLSGTGVEASERCSFCHLKDEQPLEVSQEGATPDGAPATAAAAAEGELE